MLSRLARSWAPRARRQNAAWKAALAKAPAADEAGCSNAGRRSRGAMPVADGHCRREGSVRGRHLKACDAYLVADDARASGRLPCRSCSAARLISRRPTAPRTKHHTDVAPGNFAGDYIHYGVREHGMAAAMNGMALHGSFIPYGATFLVFTDYCRPSIRLSALMHQRVDLRHDARRHRPGRGRPDAPADRAPGGAARHSEPAACFVPADALETAEALGDRAFANTRYGPRSWRSRARQCRRFCARTLGQGATSPPRAAMSSSGEACLDVTLIATGSEVGVAARSGRAQLAKDGIKAAVVSLPSFELFRVAIRRSTATPCWARHRASPSKPPSAQPWYEWLRPRDTFIGLSDFGASAPGAEAVRALRHHGRESSRCRPGARQSKELTFMNLDKLKTTSRARSSRASACSCVPTSTCRPRTAR